MGLDQELLSSFLEKSGGRLSYLEPAFLEPMIQSSGACFSFIWSRRFSHLEPAVQSSRAGVAVFWSRCFSHLEPAFQSSGAGISVI
jgi:hypothetical protein